MQKGEFVGILLCAGLSVAVVSIFGYSLNSKVENLEQINDSLQSQFSGYRTNVYVASTDISQGDEIITDGENANVVATEIYTSMKESVFYDVDSSDEAVAIEDISSGDPILSSDIGYSNKISDDDFDDDETSSGTYDDSFLLTSSYVLRAYYVDSDGNELSSSRILQLPEDVTEEDFLSCAWEDETGELQLSYISIDGEKVYSFGVEILQTEDGVIEFGYYTTKYGLERVQILQDTDVIFTYASDDTYINQSEIVDENGLYDAITVDE